MPVCSILKAEGNRLDHASLMKVADRVANGGIISYPTDTFYALGADPTNVDGVARIYAIKGRERRKPLLCIISELEAVMRLAGEIPPTFGRIAERFWPGPLTIVFKAAASIPPGALSADGTIALRLPDFELSRKIAAVCGSFITATSANRSGEVPPDNADVVRRDMANEIDLLVDAGTVGEGKTSSILDISGPAPRLIREGSISRQVLEKFLKVTL